MYYGNRTVETITPVAQQHTPHSQQALARRLTASIYCDNAVKRKKCEHKHDSITNRERPKEQVRTQTGDWFCAGLATYQRLTVSMVPGKLRPQC